VKIAHTADIHIRGLSRHDEAREVFRAFAADCRAQGVEHIAVEGDVFHTKTQGITPEYIEFLTWWLRLLADATVPRSDGQPTVHLRLGNHDGNLVNSTRQDAVTPVVDALGDPRVRLYKASGTYEFAPGFSWCVFGIFDQQGWKDVRPTPAGVNIACYHGGVAGARSETDWEIEGGLDLTFFEAYDFVFLGDIHRTQHLARRGPGDKPWISYPGTPIQQNYAEAREHCYLLWDIRSRDDFDVTERPLPNPRPFVTLEWRGSAEETVAKAGPLPPGSRCRVKGGDDLTQGDMSALTGVLRTTCAPTEVTFKVERQSARQVAAPDRSRLVKADLRSPEVLLRLLKEHHGTAATSVTDADWEEVSRLLAGYLGAIGADDDGARNVRWNLRCLTFDNMFPYGEGNSIDFDALQGITGIFGPNRSGKSSIVGTLMYSLFNTTDRGPIENLHVINARRSYCRSRFVVGVNDVDYLIERQTVRHENRKGIQQAVTSLNVFQAMPDGSYRDLCGEQRYDTEKVIKGLIGTARDFQLTSLSAQGDVERFIREGSTQRRLILARFLDIDVFERLHDAAKEDARSLRDVLRRRPVLDHAAEERRCLDRLAELDLGLRALEDEKRANAVEEESVRAELGRHSGFVPVTEAQLQDQDRALDLARGRLDSVKRELAQIDETAERRRQDVERLEAVKQKHDPAELRARLAQVSELSRATDALRHMVESSKAELDRSLRSLKTLAGVPCGDSFPDCRFIKDAHVDKSKLDSQRAAVSDLIARLEDKERDLTAAAAERIEERLKKHDRAVELLSKEAIDGARSEARREHLAASLPKLEDDLSQAQARRDQLVRDRDATENVEVIGLRARLDALRTRLHEIDSSSLRLATDRGRTHEALERCQESARELAVLERQLRLYELVMAGCSKRGIPRMIVAAELPMINAEISSILHGIVDFTVELDADEDTNALDAYLNYGDSRRLLELGSGMEKFVSSIAIRVALTNVSSLPKTDTFIIDEGFGSLDDSGREAVGRLLQSLKRYFRSILVISHVDEIKDVADNVLEITKIEKDSRVVAP